MKRTLLICMILALFLTVLPACRQTKPVVETQPVVTEAPAEPTETNPPVSREDKEALLNNWEAALKVQEALYRYTGWTLDYLDAFVADNSWDSLLKARAACLATETAFQKSPLPEYALTDEQYQALQDGKIDAEMVKTEYLSMSESVQRDLATLNLLDMMLHEDVFYKAIASDFHTWSETHRAMMACTAEYYCYATNYLLLQLDMPEIWEQLPEKYPNLFRNAAEWMTDEDEIMAATVLPLDQYEAYFMDMNDFAGRSEYVLEVVLEALENSDLEYLKKEIHTVDDVPCYIPIPDWLLVDAEHEYLVTDPDTQKKVTVRCGQTIESVPTAYYVESAGLSLEEVQTYAEILAYWGYFVNAGWKTEGKTYQIFVVEGDTKMLVEWTEESTIFYMSGSLGCLTTELRMYAQFAEKK